MGFVIDQINEKKILQKDPPENDIAKALVDICRARWDQQNAKRALEFE